MMFKFPIGSEIIRSGRVVPRTVIDHVKEGYLLSCNRNSGGVWWNRYIVEEQFKEFKGTTNHLDEYFLRKKDNK